VKTNTPEELRELDAWIAEHVMGLVRHPCWYTHEHWEGVWRVPDGTKGFNKFRPTTDPAAAMAVLEKCAEVESPVSVATCFEAGTWSVFVGGHWDEKRSAETLPLAICLFAKALFSK